MGNVFKSCRSKKGDDEKNLKKNVEPPSQPDSPPFGQQRNYTVDTEDFERIDHTQACSTSLCNDNCLPECDQQALAMLPSALLPSGEGGRGLDHKRDFTAEPGISKEVMIQMYTISQPPAVAVAEKLDKRGKERKGPYQDVVKEIKRKQELQRRSVVEEREGQHRKEQQQVEKSVEKGRLLYLQKDDLCEPLLTQLSLSKRLSKTSDSEEGETVVIKTAHRYNYNKYISSLRSAADVPRKESDASGSFDAGVYLTENEITPYSLRPKSWLVEEEFVAQTSSVQAHTPLYKRTPISACSDVFNDKLKKFSSVPDSGVSHKTPVDLQFQRLVFVPGQSNIFPDITPVRTLSGKMTLGERIRDVIVQDKHHSSHSLSPSGTPSPTEKDGALDMYGIQMPINPGAEKRSVCESSSSSGMKKKKVPPPVPPKPKHTSTQTRTIQFADAEISTDSAQLSSTAPIKKALTSSRDDPDSCSGSLCQKTRELTMKREETSLTDCVSRRSVCDEIDQKPAPHLFNKGFTDQADCTKLSESKTQWSAADTRVPECFDSSCSDNASKPLSALCGDVVCIDCSSSPCFADSNTDSLHKKAQKTAFEAEYNTKPKASICDNSDSCSMARKSSAVITDPEMRGCESASEGERIHTRWMIDQDVCDCSSSASDRDKSCRDRDSVTTLTPVPQENVSMKPCPMHEVPSSCKQGTETVLLFSDANSRQVLPCEIRDDVDGFTTSVAQSGGEEQVPERVRKLEQRQEQVLQDLEKLQQNVESLAKKRGVNLSQAATVVSPVSGVAAATTVLSQHSPQQQGKLHDLVISADPSSVPLSLLILLKQLSSQGPVLTTTFVHSSTTDISQKLRTFLPNEVGAAEHRSSYQLAVSIIWKKLPGGSPRLMVSPMRQTYIEGEANIARYFSRLLQPSYDNGNIIMTTQIDDYLDIAQQQILQGNNKEKSAALRTLNARLGKGQWLVGPSPSLADVVAWSAIQGAGLAGEAPANVKKWLKVCGESEIFRSAVQFLSS